jgi:hypothetical protein
MLNYLFELLALCSHGSLHLLLGRLCGSSPVTRCDCRRPCCLLCSSQLGLTLSQDSLHIDRTLKNDCQQQMPSVGSSFTIRSRARHAQSAFL